jgi:hypothetical protein
MAAFHMADGKAEKFAASSANAMPLITLFADSSSALGVYRFNSVKDATRYGYLDTFTDGEANEAYFKKFFSFAIAHMPTSGDQAYNYILDKDGKEITIIVGKKKVKTYYDFHVARLAQLAMAKVMFSLCIGEASRASTTTVNLTKIRDAISAIEDNLASPSESKDDFSDGSIYSPDYIYTVIKNLSNKNLSHSQVIKRLQDAISRRRTNLQTALTNESQIDKILAWSITWKYVWIALFIIVTCVAMFAIMSNNHLVIYVAIGFMLCVQLISWVLDALGIVVGSWDVAGLLANSSLLLGTPNISF